MRISGLKKISGIFLLLVAICLVTSLLSDRFLLPLNIENLLRRTSLFGLISIGAAFVIVTGGIDLSIGSIVCLAGTLLPWLLVKQHIPIVASLGLVIALAIGIGIFHGLLITKLRLQPFIVTLCGLLLYRGIARGITGDQTQGFGIAFDGLRKVATARIPLPFIEISLPATAIVLIIVGVSAAVLLNMTVYGRHLMALGRNEQAAHYSGVNTDRVTVLAYVICALLSGIGGILFVMDVNSAQPSDFGNFYELYAIAAAVLGGCSLRGGEGSIAGVIIGAAVMQVLRNSIVLLDIPTQLEFAIIGSVILGGVVVDEVVRRSSRLRK